MAKYNNKNNKTESGEDEDPTVELEVLPEELSAKIVAEQGAEAEAKVSNGDQVLPDAVMPDRKDSATSEQSQIELRTEIIKALQSEIDQLREKSTVLKNEVRVLEEITNNITEELSDTRRKKNQANESLKQRSAEVEVLKQKLHDLEKASKSEAKIVDRPIERAVADNSATSGLFQAVARYLNAAMTSRRKLSRQFEKVKAENALITLELESNKAVIEGNEREIEQLRNSQLLVSEEPAEVSVNIDQSPSKVEVEVEPQELRLLVALDDNASRELPIIADRVRLGSSPDNDIQITSHFISRHHAEIISSSKGTIVRDLNSTNGTFVNSKRVKRHALRDGDSVIFGKHCFKYVEQEVQSTGIRWGVDDAGTEK